MNNLHRDAVIGFYDRHPINEDEIFAKLLAAGIDSKHLDVETLARFDQDHYGGTGAVDELASRAGIVAGAHVLDVCSGMGGPARWLAHRYGCRVTGLDLTRSRVEAAQRLTARVGLDTLVDFVEGDATAMPLPDAGFDAVVGQEAWVHVPDKSALIRECARVVRLGGTIAFTDIVARVALQPSEQQRLYDEMSYAPLGLAHEYLALLESQGCEIVSLEDLSDVWTRLLVERLQMYRSLRDTTVAKFGQQHFESWDRGYAFFVGLYVEGRLGGTRIVARRR